MPSSLDTIRQFLACRRIAMVGVSRDPASFNTKLFEEFCRRNYEMVPVNPHVETLGGLRCFARVQDIRPKVDAAILMTSPEVAEEVVRDCAEAGIGHIWLYGLTGPSAVSASALQYCREQNLRVVAGECPYMFLPGSGVVHKLHGLIRRITGTYPSHRNGASA